MNAGTGQRPSWREETRQDRLTSAQIDRDRDAARVRARIAERQAVTQFRREDKLAREASREQARERARERRAARRAARMAWLSEHTLDLLFVPVIVVPAVLAWTAMGAYGHQLYGAPGLVLPAFSEGAMWAFAIATTWTIRKHPDRPAWHLRAGTWAFAAVAAALNFTHGLTGTGTHGVGVGVVMALVSVAGVVAHQFITAGPRRSRAERDQARIDRAAARRELAVRRAAVRHAVAVLDEHGQTRLLYEPGTVTLGRRHGRRVLGPLPARATGPESVTATRAALAGTGRAALDAPPAAPVPDEIPAVVPAASSPGGGPTGGPVEPLAEVTPEPVPGMAQAGPGPAPEPGPAEPAGTPVTVPPADSGPAVEPARPVSPVPVMFRAAPGHTGPDSGPDRPGPGLAAPPVPDEPGGVPVPVDLLGAHRAYAVSVKAGAPMSARSLAEEFGISRRQAGKITGPAERREVPA